MSVPILLLTSNATRGTLEASILLDSSNLSSSTSSGPPSPWQSLPLTSLHSLAQASLISDTQEQIARQLLEVSEQSKSERKSPKGAKEGAKRERPKRTTGSAAKAGADETKGKTGANPSPVKFANGEFFYLVPERKRGTIIFVCVCLSVRSCVHLFLPLFW
jgi:hypothetical protein